MGANVDIVVVSYNSDDELADCVGALIGADRLNVIVVDNASSDSSVEIARSLGASVVALDVNGGFAYGCNAGARRGSAPFVLFLNPDARIGPASVRRLVQVLEDDRRVGISAPLIVDDDGAIDPSQRHFPRLVQTFARALFIHRVLPHAHWVDELIRDPGAYARRATPAWVSGACLLIRRDIFEQIGGWDEEFFMYCEDIDLCARVRAAGLEIVFDPSAVVVHSGGRSAPRSSLLPVLAQSRMMYARKHRGRLGAAAERTALALEALTHVLVSRGGWPVRAGHLRALRTIGRPAPVRRG